MKSFAKLLENLLFTPSRNAKIIAMAEYFENTPDPDRGFALGVITRDLSLNNLKPTQLRTLTKSRVDPELFDMSYDYVGDIADTISLIWKQKQFNNNGDETIYEVVVSLSCLLYTSPSPRD